MFRYCRSRQLLYLCQWLLNLVLSLKVKTYAGTNDYYVRCCGQSRSGAVVHQMVALHVLKPC
jgi:hypothetical protein